MTSASIRDAAYQWLDEHAAAGRRVGLQAAGLARRAGVDVVTATRALDELARSEPDLLTVTGAVHCPDCATPFQAGSGSINAIARHVEQSFAGKPCRVCGVPFADHADDIEVIVSFGLTDAAWSKRRRSSAPEQAKSSDLEQPPAPAPLGTIIHNHGGTVVNHSSGAQLVSAGRDAHATSKAAAADAEVSETSSWKNPTVIGAVIGLVGLVVAALITALIK